MTEKVGDRATVTRFEDLESYDQGLIIDYALCRNGKHNDCSREQVVESLWAIIRQYHQYGWNPLTDDEVEQLVTIVDRRLSPYEPSMRLAQYQTAHAFICLAASIKLFVQSYSD